MKHLYTLTLIFIALVLIPIGLGTSCSNNSSQSTSTVETKTIKPDTVIDRGSDYYPIQVYYFKKGNCNYLVSIYPSYGFTMLHDEDCDNPKHNKNSLIILEKLSNIESKLDKYSNNKDYQKILIELKSLKEEIKTQK